MPISVSPIATPVSPIPTPTVVSTPDYSTLDPTLPTSLWMFDMRGQSPSLLLVVCGLIAVLGAVVRKDRCKN